MATPDEKAADSIGRAIEGRVYRLQEERRELLAATARITEIDAELLVLQNELARVSGRRPPRPVTPPNGPRVPSA